MDPPSRRSAQGSRRNSAYPPSSNSTPPRHPTRPHRTPSATPGSSSVEAAAFEAAAAMLGIQRHDAFNPHYSGMGFGHPDSSIRDSGDISRLSAMQDSYGLDLGRIEEHEDDQNVPDHGQGEVGGALEVDERELMGFDLERSESGSLEVKAEDGASEPPSGWNESKTKAGKERKRLPLACIMCRRKKIRCSGEKPACKHCVRSRIPCVYKQTARKTAPRTDYMNMLDRRMKRMEERLLKNIPKEEISSVLANTGRSVIKPSLTTLGKKRSASSAFEDSEDLWASTSRTLKKPLLEGKPGGPAPIGSGEAVDIDNGADVLPREDIQQHLAEVFFDFLHGQPFLLLHKPSYMRQLRSRTVPPILILAVCAISARYSQHPALQHDHKFLAGEKFAIEARRQILKNFDSPNIVNVTVSILLAMYEFGAGYAARAWSFSGIAIRMAHALRLHVRNNDDLQERTGLGYTEAETIFLEMEIGRRCMWACFLMDRFLAAGTDRPCLINEAEIKTRLPAKEQDFASDREGFAETLDGNRLGASREETGEEKMAGSLEQMGVGAYVVRIIAIYGRIVKWVNQEPQHRTADAADSWEHHDYQNLQDELAQFAEKLPVGYHHTPDNTGLLIAERQFGQYIFLHIAYQAARMFLQNPILTTPRDDQNQVPPNVVTWASEISLGAATRIAEIIQDARERGQTVTAPFVGFCVSSATVLLLLRMFNVVGQKQQESKRDVESCMRFLTQIQQYWAVFNLVTDDIKSLFKKLVETKKQDGGSIPLSRELANEHMLQFGDWMMKHPHGILSADGGSRPQSKTGAGGGLQSPVSTTEPPPTRKLNQPNSDDALSTTSPHDGQSRSSNPAAVPTPGSNTPQPQAQHLHPGYRHNSASSSDKHTASPVSSRHHSSSNVGGLSPAASRTPASSHPHSRQHTSPPIHQSPTNASTPMVPATASGSTGTLLHGAGDTLDHAISGTTASNVINTSINLEQDTVASYAMDQYSIPMEPRNESHASIMQHHHQLQQRRALPHQHDFHHQYETYTDISGSGFSHDSRGHEKDHHPHHLNSAAYPFDSFAATGPAGQELMEALGPNMWPEFDSGSTSLAGIMGAFGAHAEDGSRAGSVTSGVSGGAVGGGVVTGTQGIGGTSGAHSAAPAASSGWPYGIPFEPGHGQPEFHTPRRDSSDASMRRRSSGHHGRGRTKGARDFQNRRIE